MRLALALVLALAGCSIERAAAERNEGERPTIVSLNLCTDELLLELAEPDQILALSHYSGNPDLTAVSQRTIERFVITGGTAEEIIALGPDIVIADVFLAPATRQALTDLGIRVETFNIAPTVQESKAQVERMAALVGQPRRGTALIDRIDAAVEAARPEGNQPPTATVLWQLGGIVPGEATLISELMREAGLASHSQARGMAQADYLPLEQLLADPPELLVTVGEGRALHHPALSSMPNMRRARLDSSLLFCGGPTIIRAAKRLAEIREQGA